MMPVTTKAPDQYTEADAFEWIERKARQKHLNFKLYKDNVRRIGDYLYLPMWIDVEDIGKEVKYLQQIEDSWNLRKTPPRLRVFLEPAPPESFWKKKSSGK